MPREARRNNRTPDKSPQATGESAKGREISGDGTPLRVSLCYVDSPDAKARMKRALWLVLKVAQVDDTSVRTEIPQK